jgi:hypothetical protein
MEKYSGDADLGSRAVRWDASGTAATELGNIGTDGSGYTQSGATAVNVAGTAIGGARKYAGGIDVGLRAVRWDAAGTAATELGNLGTSGSGYTSTQAYAISSAGTAVGYAEKYTGGVDLGTRAVRWDGSGAATELIYLGSGYTQSLAYSINAAGVAVGEASGVSGAFPYRALLWNPNTTAAIDLGTLIDPNSGWTLVEADGISDTNWVAGWGYFDPDGGGPLAFYSREFLLDVSSIVVPEPSSIALLALGGFALLRHRWRRTWRE